MASTSPAGASSNLRRSDETIPHPPATATVGSSRARTSGVTMSPVGSTLVSSRMTTGPLARRRPIFEGGRVAESLARPDDLDRHVVRRLHGLDRPRARRPARRTGCSRRRRSRSRRVSRSEPSRSPARGPPASRWRSGRPWRDRSPAPRAATARWRSSHSGPVRPRRRRADGRGQREVDAPVGHLPAGRLDLGTQPVGLRPVACRASPRSFVRGGEDVVGDALAASPGQDSPQCPARSQPARTDRRGSAGSARA